MGESSIMTVISLRQCLYLSLILAALPGTARAQWFGNAPQLVEGEDIYRHVCQSCHMPEGKGAKSPVVSAPSLANNPSLTSAAYPIFVILNGKAAMPWFNGTLTAQQIAAVTNYIRSSFSNNFTDRVSEADVKQLAGPVPRPER